MPTPAERQAIAFLAVVAALGGAVRLVQAHTFERALAAAALPTPAEAIVRQLEAVDSVRAARSSRSGSRTTGRPATGTTSRVTSGTASRPARRDTTPPPPIDVDVAAAEELERLPRVGPALAQRIVANRDSLGPFGSLEALQRVRGIGPATAARLAPHVTFSSGPRP
jgi:competence protein ComEA